MKKSVVYLAHPVRGDVEANLQRAMCWLEYLTTPKVALIAPWIVDCMIWDDSVPEERAAGMERNFSVLDCCDELWLCGPHISDGMRAEEKFAAEHGKGILDCTDVNMAIFVEGMRIGKAIKNGAPREIVEAMHRESAEYLKTLRAA